MRVGFSAQMTQPLEQLYNVRLPTDIGTLPLHQLLVQAAKILQAVDPLFNPVPGQLNYYGAIPSTFAVAYLDIVGYAGYGYAINQDLQVGAAPKIIDPDHYVGLLSQARSDFNSPVTGVTLDIGALYKIRSTKTMVGVSIQNIIPIQKVVSTADLSVVVTDPQTNQPVKANAKVPFALVTPLIVNLSASQPILKGLVASFDWVDVASQDKIYETYTGRFRLGAEHRRELTPGGFAVAGRRRLAEKRFAGGLGIDFWHYFRIDGANGYDAMIADHSWFGSIAFGF